MEYQELEPELAKKHFDHLNSPELQKLLNHVREGAILRLQGLPDSPSTSRLKQEVIHYIENLLMERALLH